MTAKPDRRQQLPSQHCPSLGHQKQESLKASGQSAGGVYRRRPPGGFTVHPQATPVASGTRPSSPRSTTRAKGPNPQAVSTTHADVPPRTSQPSTPGPAAPPDSCSARAASAVAACRAFVSCACRPPPIASATSTSSPRRTRARTRRSSRRLARLPPSTPKSDALLQLAPTISRSSSAAPAAAVRRARTRRARAPLQ